MHFMNPPPLKKLIEIIRGADTSDETFATTKALSERLGKVVITSQDYSGFIVNRILMPMINEAFFTLYTGVGTKEDIDRGMKLGTSHPMGPLELADFIGLDVCLSIMRVLHAGLGDNKYAPCPLLVQYVDAGRLGRKRGLQNLTFPHMSDCWDGADCSNTQYYADKTKESLEEVSLLHGLIVMMVCTPYLLFEINYFCIQAENKLNYVNLLVVLSQFMSLQ
ncbi:3-hydroxybutyryl-CoA dehydrogenase [Vigna umbellata]|uniref:3-hydroxybutyryl-CoA dehydrogenase n=1 Tax=Vigna umbellata TaxID=87088 RepID=UPI001F5F740E|nr:3-hydroxybutyryl-CoA dehydrogenase [Vigna umbellata]